MPTILITGFGPFPGAPVNPTTALARHLARLRRPGLADVRLVGHVFTTGNSIGPIVLALFVALCEKQGVPPANCVINLQNDVLKEYLARGTQILKPEPASRLVSDCVAWCADQGLKWSPLTVCCNHLNAGGAGSTWATSIALGHAVHYLDDLVARGYDIDAVAPLVHMFPDERHDFFTSVATLRALRKVWAALLKDRYGARSDEALGLRVPREWQPGAQRGGAEMTHRCRAVAGLHAADRILPRAHAVEEVAHVI